MISFKPSGDATLKAVVEALEPLRSGGYLSNVAAGTFNERPVTIVASGSAPFDQISTSSGVPARDIFYDAKLDHLNSYYASADLKPTLLETQEVVQVFTEDQKNKVRKQVSPAHAAGLKVRSCKSTPRYLG